MPAFKRMLVFAVFITCLGEFAAAQQPDQLAAMRVLGPQWKQMARASGMVFAGTVLGVAASSPGTDHAMPTVEVKLRVDQAIAGVKSRQVLTIREWAGAWSSHREMRTGQRMLLFLYPPSRLGLTSPVGGSMGQVALDANGKNVAVPAAMNNVATQAARPKRADTAKQLITVRQLERAIRRAREE